MSFPADIRDYIIEILTGYPLHTNRVAREAEQARKQAKNEARAKLLRDFEEYKIAFQLYRGDVEVIKIRNRQKKFQFDLQLKTAEGSFPIEKIFSSLTRYITANRELRWQFDDLMPVESDDAAVYLDRFDRAQAVLEGDRARLDELVREIRPFIEQPL